MKKNYLLILLLLFFATGYAQITVTTTDFASAGNSVVVSNGDITQPVDIATTGSNQVWDFSTLQFTTQDTLDFLDVSSTASTYALIFFNSGLNPNRANIATAGPDIPVVGGAPVTISNVYNFYYNATASYRQVGFGAEINGISTPIIFNNKDVIYNFPIDFNSQDSSDSDYQITLPTIGYYGHSQTRVNHADGFGTLTTPYGTFPVLRVKSVINAIDTVYVDALGFGFGFAEPIITEYKWIANNQEIPLLQINTATNMSNETITSIVYRDSLRILAVNDLAGNSSHVDVYPNPTNGSFTVDFTLEKTSDIKIEVLDAAGRNVSEVLNAKFPLGNNKLPVRLGRNQVFPGIYFCKVRINDASVYKKIIVTN